MEQSFSDTIPNIKANPDGSWPQSAKHKAPRYEVPAGTDMVETEFNLNLGERPGPGRVYIIGLMAGPLGQALPVGSLAIGADDQWLVTAHGGSEGKKDIQEDGERRVIARFSKSYFISLYWEKGSSTVYTIYEDQTRSKTIHQIVVNSLLNLDSGGRILIGQDVKNPKRLKDLHSLPPFGSAFSGTIRASDMDIDEPDNTPDEPRPADPLPPIFIPPPIVTPPAQPPINQPTPPVIKPSSPATTNKGDKILGLERSDLILILKSIITSFERGEDIDLRSILAQVLAPILLTELLGRR